MRYKINYEKHPILKVNFEGSICLMNAIIDTGCRDNYVFRERFILNNDSFFKHTGDSVKGIAAGGQHVDAPEIIHSIRIGKYKFDLRFGLWANGSFKDVDVILGTKFLNENKLSFYFCGDNFILRKASSLDYFLCRVGRLYN